MPGPEESSAKANAGEGEGGWHIGEEMRSEGDAISVIASPDHDYLPLA